jgi:dihydroorotate dehydrogenase electron transfer subunit
MSEAARKGVFLARVRTNRVICDEHWCIELEVEGFPPASPGQFVQILCREPLDAPRTGGAFLRRPFSIGGLRPTANGCELDILHRAIGVGTQWLSKLSLGDPVSILGPLGVPFTIDPDRPAAILVGGGVGLPPLIWLARVLREAGKDVVAFCGARSVGLLPLRRLRDVAVTAGEASLAFEEFAGTGVPVVVATDDGSLGSTGLVTAPFERYLDARPVDPASIVIYTCGPNAMMEVVARTCEARGIPCQVCLERMMACGMGTCQSCVVQVRDERDEEGWRYHLCCTDGPVFDSRTVIWRR